eukprot:jgi/Botrbrau1/6513/Bobra.0034s0086.1
MIALGYQAFSIVLAISAFKYATATPECVNLAMRLGTGACSSMQAQSTRVAGSVSAADCDTLIATQRTLPEASDACCQDLRTFVQRGCGCDQDVGALSMLGGYNAATVLGGSRLATVSRCSDPAHGYQPLVNPCGGTCAVPQMQSLGTVSALSAAVSLAPSSGNTSHDSSAQTSVTGRKLLL